MRSRQVRAYRALLRVYPRRFRSEYQEEMCRVFAQQLHYARVTEGWPGVVRVWARSLFDLLTTAPPQHVEKDVLVASPVGSSGWQTTMDAKPSAGRWILIGLGPVWAFLGGLVLAPNWADATFLNPPAFVGLPTGVVLVGAALVWGLLGLGPLADPRSSRLQMVMLVLLALSATAVFLISWRNIGQLLSIVAVGLALLWWALGRPPLSDARPSSVRLATLLVFTIPATGLVLLTPAAVLIWLRLST